MRSSHWLLAFSLLLVSSGAARAQDNKLTPTSTVSQALDFWITNTENRVVPAADAMPGEKYSFAPTAGEFTGVRTFAQQQGFARVMCRCPVGQNSMRKQVDELIKELERLYPNARENIAKAGLLYGSDKAASP